MLYSRTSMPAQLDDALRPHPRSVRADGRAWSFRLPEGPTMAVVLRFGNVQRNAVDDGLLAVGKRDVLCTGGRSVSGASSAPEMSMAGRAQRISVRLIHAGIHHSAAGSTVYPA